jgi:large subunit ribosomal protein L10
MPLTLEQKKVVVSEVADVARHAHSAIAAEYRGLTVAEMTQLRVAARENNVYVRVVPNNLAWRAVQDTDFACLQGNLVGPLVLAFSQEEPGAAARVVGGFAKTNKKFVVKQVAFGGKLLAASELETLANLPTREQALGRMLGGMKAPITKLARTLAEPYARVVRVLAAIRDQKQGA